MSHAQNSEQKTKLGALPDETSDTGFSETSETFAQSKDAIPPDQAEGSKIYEKSELSETCSRTMSEKGFEFRSAVKENSAKAANKSFHANVTAFHAYLARSTDRDQIDRKVKDLIALAEKTEFELNSWLDLVKNTPRAELITKLLSTVKDSIQGVQSAALNKVLTLDKDETLSVGSKSSRKSRHSIKSSTSGSSHSSKETLINVKAKRAALEQKLKFSDKIEEQQKILNKLRLQQQLSETLAEEAVYEEAFKAQNPFDFDDIDQLPKETEKIIDRFVNQAEFLPTPPTSTGSLLSPLNENKELSVKSYTPTAHPPHIGPSANIVPTDIEKQAASFPDTGYATTSQLPTFSANTGGLITSQPFVLSTTNSLAAPKIGVGASTPFMSLPQVPLTPHPRDAPAVTTSLRPVHPSAFDLRPCADPFTPECSPATLYREIKPTPYVQGQNRTPPNSDSVSQIAEALAKHLDGKAKKVVEQLQYMVSASPEIAYSEARKKLKSRFGRPTIIATDFENKLVNWPKIGSNDARGLREFSDFLQQVEIAKNHLDSLKIFEYPSKLQTLVEKLPNFPPRNQRPKSTCPLPRKKLPGSINLAWKTSGECEVPSPEPKKAKSEGNSTSKFCLFHKTKSHTLNECKKFRELTWEEKRDFFKKNKLCFKCMAPSKHNAENCDQKPPVCDICHKRHLTALHMETTPDHKEKPNAPEAKNTSTACTQVCGEEETSRSCARIVLVQASHQSNPARKLTTYAVLDDQSTDVFNSDSLLEQLEVDAPEVDLQVSTIVGSNSIRTKKVTGLSFQDTENGYAPIKVPFAYSREFIPASHKDIATPQVAKQWKHLSHITDRIQHRPDVDIGLLIGRNVPAAFQPIKVIFGHNEEPWAIIGRVCKDKHSRTNAASVNRVTVEREMLLDSCEEVPITPPFKNLMSSKDLTSPKQVREMMELDYSEIHHTRKMRGTEQSESIEDKRFREILTKGLHKNVNRNWEAPLPFKSDDLSLPDNKGYCLRRLLNDSNLKEDYA
ncbi:hypothetical protein P5673_029954, partial [Acropora cervicornis]